MTRDEIEAALAAIDPGITRYHGDGKTNYTVWTPGALVEGLDSDDECEEEHQRVYVDRFTRLEADPVPGAIKAMLRTNHVPFDYEHMYEPDTEFFHHSFTCIVGG